MCYIRKRIPLHRKFLVLPVNILELLLPFRSFCDPRQDQITFVSLRFTYKVLLKPFKFILPNLQQDEVSLIPRVRTCRHLFRVVCFWQLPTVWW